MGHSKDNNMWLWCVFPLGDIIFVASKSKLFRFFRCVCDCDIFVFAFEHKKCNFSAERCNVFTLYGQ